MDFKVSMNFSAPNSAKISGDDKPARYVSEVKDDKGNIFMEVEYEDYNGDGIFDRNKEIKSITVNEKDRGVDIVKKYTSTKKDGKWDLYQQWFKGSDGKLVDMIPLKDPQEGDDTDLAKMNKDTSTLPEFVANASKNGLNVYDLVVSEKTDGSGGIKDRYIDLNGDGKLAQTEKYTRMIISKDNCNKASATVYVDKSVPPDGYYDVVETHLQDPNGDKLYNVPALSIDVSSKPLNERKMDDIK